MSTFLGTVLVPDRRRFGLVNVICVIVLHVLAGREGNLKKWGGWRGLSKGPINGHLTITMGPARIGIRDYILYKEPPFQERWVVLYLTLLKHMQNLATRVV
jgi:hypothetical protein